MYESKLLSKCNLNVKIIWIPPKNDPHSTLPPFESLNMSLLQT